MRSRKHFVLLQLFSASRLALAALFAVILITSDLDRSTLYVLIFIAVCVEITDLLDGVLARRYSLVTDFGKLFDPFIDSLSRLTLYFALASKGIAPLWLPVGMCYRDITVAYLRNLALTSNQVVSARFSGKLKAWAQGIGAPLLLLNVLIPIDETLGGKLKIATSLIVLSATIWSLVDYSIYVLRANERKIQS